MRCLGLRVGVCEWKTEHALIDDPIPVVARLPDAVLPFGLLVLLPGTAPRLVALC